MSQQNKALEQVELPGVENIILVASGKGGVGKSTVASNLAITYASQGYQTALLDADLYGPSIPILFGLENQQPGVKKVDEQDIMVPLESYGVRIMSIGFLMNSQDPVIWRGPMASNALTQLLTTTEWGRLDYLIVDMPPGTGDIIITLAQKLRQAMGLVVITPQKLAVSDGLKAANMFLNKKLSIPLLGVVENMSYFVPKKHPDEKYDVFGSGGGNELAAKTQSPLLAQIPLVQDVSESMDQGKNLLESDNGMMKEAFSSLAEAITRQTKIVASQKE